MTDSMRGRVPSRVTVMACVSVSLLACRPPQKGETIHDDPVPTAATVARVVPPAGLRAPRDRPRDTIFRAEIQRATARGPGYLLRQLGPEVYRPHGRFAGWTITRLFPDDPTLCGSSCDLAVGDVIVTVNGNPLERPEQLASLLESAPTLQSLSVVSLRAGNLRERTYRIADEPNPDGAGVGASAAPHLRGDCSSG